jgi:Gas vesicle synthesis protein GvpO
MTEEGRSAPRSQGRSDTEADESAEPGPTHDDQRSPASQRASGRTRPRARTRPHNGGRVRATTAARRAAEAVSELTGHEVETVISVEPRDDGWKIGVEVV